MADATHTVRLHRVFRAPAERVYRAFLDPDAMAKWLPPHGFTGKVHQIDMRVGGGYRMSFTNFRSGTTHVFGGTYIELTPHERIRYTDTFEDPRLPGEMHVTITLRLVAGGTDLAIVQEGLPRRCRSSWATSDGRSRCGNWPTWSKRRCTMARNAAAQRWLAPVCRACGSAQSGVTLCHSRRCGCSHGSPMFPAEACMASEARP
jgi:uncharacterized protein YndB with AHSA1/START domain